ncbi:hypothetical protein BLL42_00350 [Pseudomonas frederiksbergensis]|uniref:CHAD domain-containing protein n=1 Tax=Pseudomonas frederiksbergensis TaxID=104087 RepID=A0A1J0EED4_9PSED|nr:CHAD domain-containing protein [Pseudomonas frederiksbergensis]APC14264.1 hypothetical protein BLL42_00350 [Pseudomonas frederiksbergensis]
MLNRVEILRFQLVGQRAESRLGSSYDEIVRGSSIKNLLLQLDVWPSSFRQVEVNGGLKHIQPQIKKTLRKQIDRLHAAVDDVKFDRHELRILVRRTRYLTEAFPELSPLSRDAAKSLKGLQSALGAWHDHYQWCQKALVETDLRPLEQAWLSSATTALEKAETQLVGLAQLLPKLSGKKKLP